MTSKLLLHVFILISVVPVLDAAFCHGSPKKTAQPNLIPIDTGVPRFIRSVPNGKLYEVGSGEDAFKIIHVYGTSYEMGYAQGQLIPNDTQRMVNAVWEYMEDQIAFHRSNTIVMSILRYSLDAALDLEELITKRFTNPKFFEEIRGISDAAHVDAKKLIRIHLIGELTKGSCSMLGAWGKAVPVADSLLQLRALDWAVDGPFKDFPQVTVYHPVNSTYGQDFANFGWTGWIGSITGMNSKQMAISEIGVSFPDETFGKESRIGVPFTNLLRDILQYDRTLDDAINRISNSKRTCDLILGVGDGKLPAFRSIEYSASVANFYDDMNMQPSAEWHPRIDNVVYYGMDWDCPSFNSVLAKQIQTYYGNITAEVVIRNIVSIVQTGNMQVAVYDLTQNIAYLSNAKATYESTGGKYAYERQYVKLDMGRLFSEKAPQLQP
ncbi:hypothetical protein LOTGIDRAFT_172703 [Lottia gigantea]|uniref:Acid ceramidase N-terminal domain-containing protein n=1 Tax=Lottia gigantea TaxID=225164 RepID=V4CGG6_LOTGI|nr:hypothetical protein LOTGIDRAFT_172703 [Lottia gigantea]ESP01180.1 hypothetical protein LOTGIDRAFT_172703 [Lottia gigantea]